MTTVAVAASRETCAAPSSRWASAQFWGVVLVTPYVLVFLVFVLYPVCYGFWIARRPETYVLLFEDPIFVRSVANTLVFLVVGINLKMAVAAAVGFLRAGARLDPMALAPVHLALGAAVDTDHPVDPLHAQCGVGHRQYADLPFHRRRRPQLAQ
jgi:hypothetical protein